MAIDLKHLKAQIVRRVSIWKRLENNGFYLFIVINRK